jgi:hypothetical protein
MPATLPAAGVGSPAARLLDPPLDHLAQALWHAASSLSPARSSTGRRAWRQSAPDEVVVTLTMKLPSVRRLMTAPV